MALFRHATIFLAFWLYSSWVLACAICAPADAQKTLIRQLAAADRIVLAQTGRDAAPGRPLEVLRGAKPAGEWLLATNPAPISPLRSDDLQLLVLNPGESRWTLLGYLPPARVSWVRRLAGMAPLVPGAEPELQRARFFVPDLQDAYPLVAQTAYDEVAVQPYSVLRSLASGVDAHQLTRWLRDEAQVDRWPLFYLLLGLSGKGLDADALERRIQERRAGCSSAELSAMLAALVAVRAEAGLAWLERNFLASPLLPDAQVQSALLALSVQGTDAVAVSRDQVVVAYGRYIERNPQRAGFVASDLATWGRWEFAQAFATALRSGGSQVFASRYAMVFYLLRNPQAQAKALVEALRAEKLM